MILCEVALGKIKEVGLFHNDNDDDNTKQLDLNEFQSCKASGRNIPNPRYTITRNYGLYDEERFLLNILPLFLRCSYATRRINSEYEIWFERS